MVVKDAIRESVRTNSIIHLENLLENLENLEDELLVESDGSADAGPVTEYWGTTDAGHEWRIHVHHR